MPNAVITGCGRLGRRHLEALAALPKPFQIWAVDPFNEALSLAADSFLDVNEHGHHTLHLSTRFDDLPNKADIVISATNSDSRLGALRALLERVKVDNLILEKVLFSRLSDFDVAEQLFKGNCENIWVNCPRRANTTYAEIKKHICNAKTINMVVSGGSWGLASNAIHFIDLYAFLSGRLLEHVDTSKLDPFSTNPNAKVS